MHNLKILTYRVHRAGPREKIYFKPEEVKAAIVTCGGLCPGLNDVIRQVNFFFLVFFILLFILSDRLFSFILLFYF